LKKPHDANADCGFFMFDPPDELNPQGSVLKGIVLIIVLIKILI
jgi:hypothetical protein